LDKKTLQYAVVAIGIVATAVPVAILTPGWQGYALGVWIMLVGAVVSYGVVHLSALFGLPGFIRSLSTQEGLHLEKRCDHQHEVAEAFNEFLENADKQLMDIAASAGRLVPISRELADGYMMTHQKSQMQNQYGNAVAASVRELEVMRVQVHEQNQSIRAAVDEAVNGAEESLATVAITSSSMRDLAESTEQAAQQVDVLANVNTEILSIAQTITDIAESTNLLALNAAIEAARAGEHGRGFAVVADEVRRLSAQTQAATANIRDLADSVGMESEKTVKQILLTRDSAVTTQSAMEKATSEINDIAGAVQRIKGLSDEITHAMQQQQQVAVSASENVSSLVSLNESVANEQSHSVSEADLLKLAETLRAKIRVFINSDDAWDDQLRPKKPIQATAAPVPSAASAADSSPAGDDVELF